MLPPTHPGEPCATYCTPLTEASSGLRIMPKHTNVDTPNRKYHSGTYPPCQNKRYTFDSKKGIPRCVQERYTTCVQENKHHVVSKKRYTTLCPIKKRYATLSHLQPLPQVVLLHRRLGRKYNRRHRPLRHRRTVRPVANNHAAVQPLVLHHLCPQEVRQPTRGRLARTLNRQQRTQVEQVEKPVTVQYRTR